MEKFEAINAVIRKFQLKNLVGTLCRTAGVSRSGYYAWLEKVEQHAIREQQDYEDDPIDVPSAQLHRQRSYGIIFWSL